MTVEPPPPPPEIADLEKPEPYNPPVEHVKDKADDWNDMVTKANALAEKERLKQEAKMTKELNEIDKEFDKQVKEKLKKKDITWESPK